MPFCLIHYWNWFCLLRDRSYLVPVASNTIWKYRKNSFFNHFVQEFGPCSESSLSAVLPLVTLCWQKCQRQPQWHYLPWFPWVMWQQIETIQGILNGEVSLYCWPPVWLGWNQLYEYCQFLFLFIKQAYPKQSNRRSTVQWYFPL